MPMQQCVYGVPTHASQRVREECPKYENTKMNGEARVCRERVRERESRVHRDARAEREVEKREKRVSTGSAVPCSSVRG